MQSQARTKFTLYIIITITILSQPFTDFFKKIMYLVAYMTYSKKKVPQTSLAPIHKGRASFSPEYALLK